jgi:hypothetical protein
MNKHLYEVIQNITEAHRNKLKGSARNYMEVDLGKQAEAMGYPELKKRYSNVNAIVPMKDPVEGMKVRIDGRTFVDYAQFESGVAVPGYVAKDAGIPYATYIPNDSMVLNFV